MQLAPEWPLRNSELARPVRIEAAESGMLYQRVPHSVGPMLGFEDHNLVLVPSQTVARFDLHDINGELVPLDPETDCRAENPTRAFRAIECHRGGSVLQAHRPEEPGDAEHVIGVIVAEKNFSKAEPHTKSHHLALVPLATIEQQRLALAVNGEAGNVPVDRRRGCAGAEKGDAEHAGRYSVSGSSKKRVRGVQELSEQRRSTQATAYRSRCFLPAYGSLEELHRHRNLARVLRQLVQQVLHSLRELPDIVVESAVGHELAQRPLAPVHAG